MNAEVCKGCGSIGSCCETAKMRQETGESLGRLVNRQSVEITRLQRELGEARQVASDLRGKVPA